MDQTVNSQSPPTGKKRISKVELRALVNSGQFLIKTDAGMLITDWKSLSETYEFSPPVPSTKVDETVYTVAQIEHFGDALVAVSARLICHELFGKSTRHYFQFATDFISNRNLRTAPNVKSGDQFEVILGQTFIQKGADAAVELGVTMLKTTSVYQDALTLATALRTFPRHANP